MCLVQVLYKSIEKKSSFIFEIIIGSIAQLVQSIALTRRGSQVRTLLLPQKPPSPVAFFLNEKLRAISSVGSEHYLDKVGVTGSSPVLPTKKKPQSKVWPYFIYVLMSEVSTF